MLRPYTALIDTALVSYGGPSVLHSRSHGQQGGGEPDGFPRVGLSPLICVLSLLANTIMGPLNACLRMKPYQAIPICDCGEPLVPIPAPPFALEQPHAYVQLGAPYGARSPYYLRHGVLESLLSAQTRLTELHPGWRIQIFDAYRPIAVQQFMVDYTFQDLLRQRGLVETHLTEEQRQDLFELVYEFWAVPSADPAMPPPHSTGAAVDVTLVDALGHPVDMGSPIDELSPRSYPDYFAEADAADGQTAHQHRLLLKWVMTGSGFQAHPREWWHFSQGDQFWAWLVNQANPTAAAVARYGAV
jgi:zinc D-Ala-D-Ala dipeptidase